MKNLYPQLSIERIQNPNRLYAIPLLGFFVKVIITIPVGLELWALKIAQLFFSMLNSTNIFFRGRYWKMAYQLNLGIMQLETNVNFFLWGLTDTYPGFSLVTTSYKLNMDFNGKPNRVLATPFLGVVFRFVMLIPYLIYTQVLSTAAFIAVAVGWIFVLSNGKYPETVFELARDSVRVSNAVTMYFLGMSDAYPSWYMSFNHKVYKIVFLVIAAIVVLMSFVGRVNNFSSHTRMQKSYPVKSVEQPKSSYTY